LGQEGNNGGTRVASDDGDVLVGGVGVLELRDEARGTDDVEGGDTEEALGVVDALGLEDLGGDGDGGVDLRMSVLPMTRLCMSTYGVGDDQDVGLGGVLSGGLGEVADDGGIGVEQVCGLVNGALPATSLASGVLPSRVMPGLRGTPAGMTTISAPLSASARPEGVASWPWTFWCVSQCVVQRLGKGIIPRSWC
jgi:hypothetical protein